MSPNENISKGDLELYCLDVLSQDEHKQVEQNLLDQNYDAERIEIEETLEFFAQQNSTLPPPSLKKNIIDLIENEQPKPTVRVPFTVRYSLAASVSIAILASILSVFYWYKWQSSESQRLALQEEKYLITENIQFTYQKLSTAKEAIAVLVDPQFKTVPLSGTYQETEFNASVYWNPSNEETYLNLGNLKPLPPNQQYQLWSIQNGQPIDAGVVDFNPEDSLIKMKENAQGQAFAITIEPVGGSKNPTIEQLVVMGTI